MKVKIPFIKDREHKLKTKKQTFFKRIKKLRKLDNKVKQLLLSDKAFEVVNNIINLTVSEDKETKLLGEALVKQHLYLLPFKIQKYITSFWGSGRLRDMTKAQRHAYISNLIYEYVHIRTEVIVEQATNKYNNGGINPYFLNFRKEINHREHLQRNITNLNKRLERHVG